MRTTHMHVFTSAQMYMHVHTFIHYVDIATCEYCICISCKLMLVRMYVCMHVLHRWQKGWGYGAAAPPHFKGAP